MNRMLKIINARIITPDQIILNGNLLIVDGKIDAISESTIDVADAEIMNAKDLFVAAGFIDMHVHGGGGHDFMDGTVEAFLKIAETHARYGTTSLMPTTLTSELDELYQLLEVYKEANQKNQNGAQFIGIHLEGPYFSMNQRGAQDPRYIRDPDPAEYEEIIRRSPDIKRWSAAPEKKGAIEFGRYLKSKGILVSMGHTDAIYEEALTAFENGFTLATHFYSCMSGVSRRNLLRYAGVIETAYLLDEMDVEIIADGIHLPAALLKLIVKIKGTPHTALITDAMRSAGMAPGESMLGNKKNGLRVIVEDGVAKLPDRSAFAGSVATADQLVRTMIRLADVSLMDAVKMITQTPASILGISETKGSLVVGKDADIVLFDKDIQVASTIVSGKIIYQNESV
ncbi:MAG TPA: N-acetylglucosamine-6-phosphate deacetylase [Flavisolibacter sp.]|nr:N-acetylglucosamine-6-phosphate deacetylase [Flavisolibacter sp.]